MNQHRENLEKLIKMMEGVRSTSFEMYRPKDNYSPMTEYEASIYIDIETLLSIRELTRMFIEELNSEYLQCSEGDEVVKFIEGMIEWLQLAYDFTIKNNAGNTGVKSLKVCSQSLNDYKKVYEKAKGSRVIKGAENVIATIENVRGFEFGKRNLPRVEFNDIGMTMNEGRVYIHNDPSIIDPKYIKKIDEIYEWVKNQKTIGAK